MKKVKEFKKKWKDFNEFRKDFVKLGRDLSIMARHPVETYIESFRIIIREVRRKIRESELTVSERYDLEKAIFKFQKVFYVKDGFFKRRGKIFSREDLGTATDEELVDVFSILVSQYESGFKKMKRGKK